MVLKLAPASIGAALARGLGPRASVVGAVVAFVLIVAIWLPQLWLWGELTASGARLPPTTIDQVYASLAATVLLDLVAMVLLWRAFRPAPRVQAMAPWRRHALGALAIMLVVLVVWAPQVWVVVASWARGEPPPPPAISLLSSSVYAGLPFMALAVALLWRASRLLARDERERR